MSYFTIKNFTRYNTEDLEAVLRMVEEAAAVSSSRRLSRTPLSPVHPVIMFKTYKPSSLYKTEQHWRGNGMEITQVRRYVKTVQAWGRPQQDVRIVDPANLYDTPIEALAALGAGTEVLPRAAVLQICTRLQRFFPGSWVGSDTSRMEAWGADLPVVRIEAKKQGQETQAVKKEAALFQARKSWSESVRYLRKAHDALLLAERSHVSAKNRLRRSKAVLTDEQNRLDTNMYLLLEQAKELTDCLTACLSVVQDVSPETD